MESKLVQIPNTNVKPRNTNHYMDLLSWQRDFTDRNMSIITLVRSMEDDLSTALIGSLVYNTDPDALERIKSAFMWMLDSVKDNIEQVSPEIVEELKKSEPDLF